MTVFGTGAHTITWKVLMIDYVLHIILEDILIGMIIKRNKIIIGGNIIPINLQISLHLQHFLLSQMSNIIKLKPTSCV